MAAASAGGEKSRRISLVPPAPAGPSAAVAPRSTPDSEGLLRAPVADGRRPSRAGDLTTGDGETPGSSGAPYPVPEDLATSIALPPWQRTDDPHVQYLGPRLASHQGSGGCGVRGPPVNRHPDPVIRYQAGPPVKY